MRGILITLGLGALAFGAYHDGGAVTTDRPIEVGIFAVAIVVLAILATPTARRLQHDRRRQSGREVNDADARKPNSESTGQVFDWSRLADHHSDRSDRVERAG